MHFALIGLELVIPVAILSFMFGWWCHNRIKPADPENITNMLLISDLGQARLEVERWKAKAATKTISLSNQVLPKAATDYIKCLKLRLDAWEKYGGKADNCGDQYCVKHEGCKALTEAYKDFPDYGLEESKQISRSAFRSV